MAVIRQIGYATDTGKKRRRNEDDYVVEPPLFAVADGMGGAQAGELASSLAAGAVRDDSSDAVGSGERHVAELIQEANRRVYQRSNEDATVSGMGTTMTVALVQDSHVAFGHVGDSRAYLMREGRLEQLTEDHSLVQELVRSGQLSPEEADTHPQRSVITRALGSDPDVDVDTFSIDAHEDDLFMLCSDGLTSMLDDDVILRTVEKHRDNLQATAKALIKAANKAGGEDNITVVFFEIGDDAGEPLEETAQYPTLDELESKDDDEDTLDELDRVPAVDTMVVAPEDAARFAEAPAPERRTRSRVIPALLVILVALAVVAIVLWTLSR